MTLEDVARLFRRSRRTIMRWVDLNKLPPPFNTTPMTFDDDEINEYHKRMRDEAKHGRKQPEQPEPDIRRRHRKTGAGDAA